jgi:hypothetical protein
VLNPTRNPLTVTKTRVEVCTIRVDEAEWEVFLKEEEIILPPNGSDLQEDSPGRYNFFVNIEISEKMARLWAENSLYVVLSGSVSVKPAIGQIEDQAFNYCLSGGPSELRIVAGETPLIKTPTDRKSAHEKQKQKAT